MGVSGAPMTTNVISAPIYQFSKTCFYCADLYHPESCKLIFQHLQSWMEAPYELSWGRQGSSNTSHLVPAQQYKQSYTSSWIPKQPINPTQQFNQQRNHLCKAVSIILSLFWRNIWCETMIGPITSNNHSKQGCISTKLGSPNEVACK